ncbi:hypothetical protein DVH24_017229 [Malus domestica]|uniref:Uncharacterized protein n=1 Tax=Malus domestica TaxID=3750 RepID=A0A498IS65_MALDO|nr:hypothetical protein DVH24_017229 [Malus domestica]
MARKSYEYSQKPSKADKRKSTQDTIPRKNISRLIFRHFLALSFPRRDGIPDTEMLLLPGSDRSLAASPNLETIDGHGGLARMQRQRAFFLLKFGFW